MVEYDRLDGVLGAVRLNKRHGIGLSLWVDIQTLDDAPQMSDALNPWMFENSVWKCRMWSNQTFIDQTEL